jgi:hypothetical protein
MKRLFATGSFGLFLLACAASVEAQTPDFTTCTTANFKGGASFGDGSQTALFGGAIGWELTPRVAIETTLHWLVPNKGADAFSVMFTAQAPLVGRRTFVPFVSGGLGVYSAGFDADATDIPEFYARRMDPPGVPSGDERFTDPAVVFGGGVSVFTSRNMSIRPEVETLWVRQDSMNHFVTSVSVRFAYHFELHRVTPTTRPK